MNKISQMLKEEREKKGLSLHEIGMILKINPKILKAIEDNDTAQLPAKTFLRGFIKAYAQFLKLDVDYILNLFQEEYGSTKPEAPAQQISGHQQGNIATTSAAQTTPEQVTSPKIANSETPIKKLDSSVIPQDNKSKMYTVISGIILLIIIAFVAKMMDKYQKESKISQDDVLNAVGSTTTTTLPGPTDGAGLSTPIDGSTTTTTLASANDLVSSSTSTSTSTTSSTTSSTTTSTTTTTTTIKPRPITTTTIPTSTTSTTVVSASIASTTSTSTTTTLKGKAVEVIVEALAKVTIRYSFNEGKWETLSLNTDQVHTFRSRSPIKFEFTDGGAVNIIVNGKDIGTPGAKQKPLNISYP